MSAEQNVDLPAPAGPVMNTAYRMVWVGVRDEYSRVYG